MLCKALVSYNAHKLLHHNRPQAYFRRYSVATLAEIWAQDTRYIQHAGKPGRPIVSSSGSPIQRIPQFINYHLKSLVQHHPTQRTPQTSFKRSHNWDTFHQEASWSHSMSPHFTQPSLHGEGEEACRGALDTRILDTPTTIHSSASADDGGDGDSQQFCT